MIASYIYFEKSILRRQLSKIVVLQLMDFWCGEKRERAIFSQKLWARKLLIPKIQDKNEQQQQMKWAYTQKSALKRLLQWIVFSGLLWKI